MKKLIVLLAVLLFSGCNLVSPEIEETNDDIQKQESLSIKSETSSFGSTVPFPGTTVPFPGTTAPFPGTSLDNSNVIVEQLQQKSDSLSSEINASSQRIEELNAEVKAGSPTAAQEVQVEMIRLQSLMNQYNKFF